MVVLPSQEVELAITLLYQLGEGAAEDALKPSQPLQRLAAGNQHFLLYQPSGNPRKVTGSICLAMT